MYGYPGLDVGLNISWFPEIVAFPEAMRHLTLNSRNSGQWTIVITIVIVVRTIQKCQIFTFPIVLLAVILPPKFLSFKIQFPCNFCVN